MEPKRPSELLRDAAKSVSQALEQMDGTYEACSGCGSKRYHNLLHADVIRRFDDLPDRLAFAASRFEIIEAEEKAQGLPAGALGANRRLDDIR